MEFEVHQNTPARGWSSSQDVSPPPRDPGGSTSSGWPAVSGQRLAGCLRDLDQWSHVFVGLILVTVALTSMAFMLIIYMRSWWVFVNQHPQPCDAPLDKILCGLLLLKTVFLARTWICRALHKACGWHVGPRALTCQAMALGLLCFCLAYYTTLMGMNRLRTAASCRKTAPVLYDWAAYMLPKGALHFLVLHTVAAMSIAALMRTRSRTKHSSKGLDPAAIEALDGVQPEAGSVCVICLDGYADEARAREMPCCRVHFHAECLEGWLRSHQTCPICRTELQCIRR